jgi:hypothetical protein
MGRCQHPSLRNDRTPTQECPLGCLDFERDLPGVIFNIRLLATNDAAATELDCFLSNQAFSQSCSDGQSENQHQSPRLRLHSASPY